MRPEVDTKFFSEALAEITSRSAGELTGPQLSQVLRRAQELKDAARQGHHFETRPPSNFSASDI
jgi:hypothetical protein